MGFRKKINGLSIPSSSIGRSAICLVDVNTAQDPAILFSAMKFKQSIGTNLKTTKIAAITRHDGKQIYFVGLPILIVLLYYLCAVFGPVQNYFTKFDTDALTPEQAWEKLDALYEIFMFTPNNNVTLTITSSNTHSDNDSINISISRGRLPWADVNTVANFVVLPSLLTSFEVSTLRNMLPPNFDLDKVFFLFFFG